MQLAYTNLTLFFPCSYDYLIVTNEKDLIFGDYIYCGGHTGKTVLITGQFVVIHFYSDNVVEKRGFLLLFTTTPHCKYRAHRSMTEARKALVKLTLASLTKEIADTF